MANVKIPVNGFIQAVSYANDDLELFDSIQEIYAEWENYQESESRKLQPQEIQYMTAMLIDGILPPQGQKALGLTYLQACKEIRGKKLNVQTLGIHPPKRGRKKDIHNKLSRLREVAKLIKGGDSKSYAYSVVSEKYHVSIDTVRRDYERAMKKRKQKKN